MPAQFDELKATARDPAKRYADAAAMGEELDAIADELGLPEFRVPAPRNSAQHASAVLHHRAAPAHQGAHPRARRLVATGRSRISRRVKAIRRDRDERVPLGPAARQRVLLFWVAAVLVFTGLVAVAAWTVGSNIVV